MKLRLYQNLVFALTMGGVIFSGYLSGTKLLSGTCALNEPCPYFLGYPACWYGFVMFFMMFIIAVKDFFIERQQEIAC